MEEELAALAGEAAEFLRETDDPILCFSHYDCDGIAAAVIVNRMLTRADKEFEQVFLDELTEPKLKEELFDRDQPVVLFTDIGSGQIETITGLIGDRDIVIADHHEVQAEEDIACHVNPHLVGIDGGEAISGAGVTYLVAKEMNGENRDLIQYALVGATGDIQTSDDGEYLGMNEQFVEEAKERDIVEVKKGLKLYGRQGRSIVKALKYTTDPYLEGISDNESGAVHFLRSLDIELEDDDGNWRSLADLSEAEEQKIIHGLITKGYGDIERLLGDVYLLDNGWEIREFSSLLNACGRLERPHDGITICIEQDDDLARRVKKAYGRKISSYLSFVEDNLENSQVVTDIDNGTLIQADGRIDANMIGTVATICIKSGIVSGPIVIGMAEKEEEHMKISARATDDVLDAGLEMSTLMEEACAECDGEGGGHRKAAGGKIPREEQERFINVMTEVVKESL